MIAYKYQYKDRQVPETISVIPASHQDAQHVQEAAGAAYGVSPEIAAEWFGADQILSRIEHFPEGQFIAQEDATGRVVGMTSSLRFQYNPEVSFVENWDRTTGYG